MKALLSFVLLSGILCWMMFSSVYKHVLIMRQALLQQEVDLLLETGTQAHRGYISAAQLEESRARLEAKGFRAADLEYAVESTSGADATDPSAPIPRGEGIRLRIVYPYDDLLLIDRLIGMTPPGADERIGGAGLRMSEYVPPIGGG